jgi:hypothetical protein
MGAAALVVEKLDESGLSRLRLIETRPLLGGIDPPLPTGTRPRHLPAAQVAHFESVE